RILEKLPLFVMCAASSWITLRAQTFEGAVNPASFPPGLRAENAVLSYARYLGKIFWPSKLAIVYPHPRWSIQLWQVAIAGLLLGQSGRLDAAAPHFCAALEINPRDEMAHANFGYFRLAQGDAAGAAQQFKLAIANTGNRHMAAQMYADLGALAWKRRDIEAAKNSYLESLRLMPD